MRTALVVATVLLMPACDRSTANPEESASAHEAHAAKPNAKHDGHEHGHHRFEDADEWAKHFDSADRDDWQKPEDVIAFLGLQPNAIVADLGAGTGYFAVKIAPVVPEGKVLANDVEPDMIRYLRERAEKEGLANLVPVQGSAAGPGLPEPADVAFLCDVYHHIADRPAYFGKVREQLRPGGKLVIVDFRKDAREDIPGPPPAMRIAATDLIAELEGAGWKHVRTDVDTLPHQYIVEMVPASE